jgi:hypothetical protein
MLVFSLVLVGLATMLLLRPTLAKNQAIEKAEKLGFTLTIQKVQPIGLFGGYVFSGMHLVSTDLPVEITLDDVRVTLVGAKLESAMVTGGTVKISGQADLVKNQVEAWRAKHKGSGSGDKASLKVSGLHVEWDGPCDESKAVAEGVGGDNSDEWKFSASSFSGGCKGVQVQAQGLKFSPRENNVEAEDAVVTYSGASLHATNAGVMLKDTDLRSMADTVEVDLPKIHKVAFGHTSFSILVRKLESNYTFDIAFSTAGVQGKYQAVTGKKVDLGAAALFVGGSVDSFPVWPHIFVPEEMQWSAEPGPKRANLGLKKAKVYFSGSWTPKAFAISLELPATDCQDLLDAVPDGMNGAIAGLTMTGQASAWLHIQRDSPDDKDPVVHFSYKNGCKVTHAPDGADRATLRSSFTRLVPDPFGELVEINTGPGSGKWVNISQISPFTIAAIQATEDPGFFGHHGFEAAAIESSIREDIIAGKFIRGASTVTMQLAKNLWLTREKTLARKLQEAFLTTYLEQTLSKQEILETYFNIVQFGPTTYGIGDAAATYFKSKPADLSLSQALFLSSLLPNPKVNWFGTDNRLQPSRQKYLQTLMQVMLKRHLITQPQYDEGVTEVVVKGQPTPEHAAN